MTTGIKRLVYGEGLIQNANVCIVGEAPGAEEVRMGKPFVGASGSLLWRLLGSAGIARQDCYITNVVKEQPAGNDIKNFIQFRGGSAYPTQAYKEYEERFREEIDPFKGNLIIAVGGTALWALCRKTGITKWRGSIIPDYKGRKVIPTIHPASALRQYSFVHFITHDLNRCASEMQFPDLRLPSRTLHIYPTYMEAIDYVREAENRQIVAVDIEVMGTEVSCISIAHTPQSSMSIPFVRGTASYYTEEEEGNIWRALARLFENRSVTKAFQNGVFDYTFMFRRYGICIAPIVDTMIGQAITYPDFPKGLDFITSVYTREPYYKDEGKKWFKMGGSESEFYRYNAKDSAVCLEAWPIIEQVAEKQGNLDTVQQQTRLVEPLVYMHTRGMRVDKQGLEEASARAEERLGTLSEELNRLVGYEINANSTKQLQKLFYIDRGEKPYISRKTGSITVDGDALKRLARKGYKEASVVLEIRHWTKLKSTYLDVVLDKDNRLRCAFNPVGTTSGRLSSSEDIFGVGTNTQNLPEEFKEFIIADNDTVLFNVDLSQAENRVVAYISPEPAMINAFETGIDVHRQTAALIFNKPIDQISDEVGSSTIGNGSMSERFWGKKSNHSLNYDLGYKSFALVTEIPEADARFIVDRYHMAYPGVRQYHAWVRDRLGRGRMLENPFGRRRTFSDRWGDQLFKEAYSWIPQSTVADKINRQGLLYAYYNQEQCAPIDILNQVHDSIVFQCNFVKHTWEEIANAILCLKKSLETPIVWKGTSFVIPAEFEMGIRLSKKGLRKVKINGDENPTRLAGQLYDLYRAFRASFSL